MRKYPFIALALLMAAVGCKVAEETPEKVSRVEKMYPVHFVADEIETRTAFGEAVTANGKKSYPTLWTANDKKIAVSLNLNGFRGADVIPSEDFRSASFDTEFPESEVTAPYVFYALSPFSATIGATSNHGGYHFNILTEQTPLSTSCDEGAQVMAAKQTAAAMADFPNIDLHFSHVTAYGKLTLNHVSLPDGATLQSIDLTASVPFAGRFYYKYEDGSLEESSPSRTVTLLPTNLKLENGSIADIWFACAPADLGNGTIRVDVNTSAGVLSRTVSIPEGRLAFLRGQVSKFSVNMESAEFTPAADRWVLVTDASTLQAGDEIIIANSATVGAAYAISTTQQQNYRDFVSVSIIQDAAGKAIQNPGATVERFILVAGTGTYSSCFRFKDATNASEGYLYAPNSADNNYLQTGNNNNAFDNWMITISNELAVISTYGTVKKSNTNYYRQIRFNSDRFATYRSTSRKEWSSSTTGTKGTYIYRKEAGVNVDDDPILEQVAYGAYLSGGNRVYGAGDQLSREYMNDGTVTFAILTPGTFTVAEFGNIPVDPAKGDTFTLNYNLISGRNESDTDYNVTVVKVDGPKVWLSAGGGNGFIVKK